MKNVIQSEYASSHLNEQLSIHYFIGVCNDLKWKYRQYSQDNDIDGELEIFDDENEFFKNLTTSKFIKIQLKSVAELKNKKYSCPMKLLKFVEKCDCPVVLIVYDTNAKIAYWKYLQKIVFDNAKKQNCTSLRIEFSDKECLRENGQVNSKFKEEIIELSLNSSLEIQMMQKKINIDNFYEIIDSFYVNENKKSIHVYLNPIFSSNERIIESIVYKIKELEKINLKLVIFIFDSLNKVQTDDWINYYEINQGTIKNKVKKNLEQRFSNKKKKNMEESIDILQDFLNRLKSILINIKEHKNLVELEEDIFDIHNRLEAINQVEELEKDEYQYNIEMPYKCKRLYFNMLDLSESLTEVFYDDFSLQNFKNYMERIERDMSILSSNFSDFKNSRVKKLK